MCANRSWHVISGSVNRDSCLLAEIASNLIFPDVFSDDKRLFIFKYVEKERCRKFVDIFNVKFSFTEDWLRVSSIGTPPAEISTCGIVKIVYPTPKPAQVHNLCHRLRWALLHLR